MTLSNDFVPMLAAAGGGPHALMMLPFAVLLVSIATMPFIHAAWWHRHFPKVSVGLGAMTVVYYMLVLGNGGRLLHVGHEYLSFMALVSSLFVVSGGVHISVKGEAKPGMNCLFLLCGAVLANFVGTTGASMLLIRPWIRMNKYRITAYHVVFFIFIVSNVGGCLTPIGDPPLFLGYLKGVPFGWTLRHCIFGWAVAVGALLAIFYIFDRHNFLRAPAAVRDAETAASRWRFEGGLNIVFLAVIIGAVFVSRPAGVRELLMVGAGAASYFFTPKSVHESNDLSFGPIREVAWLFLGIFATMVPALDYLHAHASGLGIDSPMKLYWVAGSLSAVLDNAPTYMTFLAVAMGMQQLNLDSTVDVVRFASVHSAELAGISLGAVFFGAMTYIGNAPNFMIKAIADQSKVKAPEFFGYLFRFALPILLPVLVLVALLQFVLGR